MHAVPKSAVLPSRGANAGHDQMLCDVPYCALQADGEPATRVIAQRDTRRTRAVRDAAAVRPAVAEDAR